MRKRLRAFLHREAGHCKKRQALQQKDAMGPCGEMQVMYRSLTGLLLLLVASSCHGDRILVFPEDGSHWINMEVILKELHARGHSLTVLRSSRSWYIREQSLHYTSITIQPAEDTGGEVGPDLYSVLVQRSLELHKMFPLRRFFEQQKDVAGMLQIFHGTALGMISTILQDSALVGRLRTASFDLVLTDPVFPAGVLLAQYLSLRMVYNVRWINAGEAHMVLAPTPPSYVPMYNSLFNDNMGFLQRTENLVRYTAMILQEQLVILPLYQDLLERHFPPGADMLSMQLSADIWLVRADFVFEFPRPTMPNVVYIGGFQCRASQPLPDELEAFMQSSMDQGVVVMSLGTMVSALPVEITEAIAKAFAQLPQKVVWRYLGQRPTSLGNNTLLLDWMPQNDLLGHPKTRAFVAHGGTNGLYEAIYHGVPVLGLPLLFDQFDNLVRLKVRGAARVVEVSSLTTENFLEALRDILENPSYLYNMQRLSRLHHDQPLSPIDSAIFWIEYVIRNKGASHLHSAAINLPWYTYHSLDVVLFLLVLIGATIWVLVSICRLICCRRYRTKNKVE